MILICFRIHLDMFLFYSKGKKTVVEAIFLFKKVLWACFTIERKYTQALYNRNQLDQK